MSPGEYSTKKLLGTALLEAELISAPQLDTALEEQKRTGGKIGYDLVRLGFLSASQLADFLSENSAVGQIREELAERQKAAALFPRHLAFYYRIAPVKLEKKNLTVGVSRVEH